MHIAIVSIGYPYGKTQSFTFVKQIAEALADKNVKITVVSPTSVTKSLVRGTDLGPYKCDELTKNGSHITVYRPKVITVGNIKIGNWSLNDSQNKSAINRTLKRIHSKEPIDVVYCHFWNTAKCSSRFALDYKLPLFVANGESSIDRCEYKPEFFEALRGVVCVSTKCKEESIAQGYLREGTPVKVIPNAVDTSKFYHFDKEQARKAKAFPLNDFVVAFTGYFIKRKGANRVSAAIDKLENLGIRSIFLGYSPDEDKTYAPSCNGILYQGSVKHNEVAEYLNCADVFCLPTLNEGCCNAIVEAMACGLPVISSNLSFNDDILTDKNSIRIDPMDVDGISAALKELYDNPDLCKKMSDSALETARSLTIDKRAENILKFINSVKYKIKTNSL